MNEEMELEELKKDLHDLKNFVEEIRNSLLGTAFTNNRGLIHKIDDHEARIIKLENMVLKGRWVILGLAAGSGAAIWKLAEHLFSLINIK